MSMGCISTGRSMEWGSGARGGALGVSSLGVSSLGLTRSTTGGGGAALLAFLAKKSVIVPLFGAILTVEGLAGRPASAAGDHVATTGLRPTFG